MDAVFRNQFLRTVLSLCRLGARADAEDVRDDVSGECADALEMWTTPAPDVKIRQIRRWCDGVDSLLERLHGQPGVEQTSLVRTQLLLLRLRTQLPAVKTEESAQPVSARRTRVEAEPAKKPSGNKVQLLDAIGASPDIRAKDLAERFTGTMSERTVKRQLAELTTEGLVVRTIHEDRTVSYRIAS